jgi:hypothetical protein
LERYIPESCQAFHALKIGKFSIMEFVVILRIGTQYPCMSRHDHVHEYVPKTTIRVTKSTHTNDISDIFTTSLSIDPRDFIIPLDHRSWLTRPKDNPTPS